jgi:hypothetical protein
MVHAVQEGNYQVGFDLQQARFGIVVFELGVRHEQKNEIEGGCGNAVRLSHCSVGRGRN